LSKSCQKVVLKLAKSCQKVIKNSETGRRRRRRRRSSRRRIIVAPRPGTHYLVAPGKNGQKVVKKLSKSCQKVVKSWQKVSKL
jgi:hypothetical protein